MKAKIKDRQKTSTDILELEVESEQLVSSKNDLKIELQHVEEEEEEVDL